MKDRHGSTLEKGDHVRVVDDPVDSAGFSADPEVIEVGGVYSIKLLGRLAKLEREDFEGATRTWCVPKHLERVVEDAEGNWIGVGDEVEDAGIDARVTGFSRDADRSSLPSDQAIEVEPLSAQVPWEWAEPAKVVLVEPELVEPELSEDARKALAGIQVYVAGPYSEGDLGQNIRQVIFAAEVLTERGRRRGHHVAPWIPHLNKLWDDEVPHEYEFWLDLDFVHLANSDACFRVGGHSPGADRERAVCEQLDIPFFTCFAGFEEWLEDYDG